ncbi:unnamed protein product [Closterium sp. NIES-54]
MHKLLRGMRLPNHQWLEAMDHAVMLHNLLSSSSLPNNASPHLLRTGKQGSTKMLRVFDCMVRYRPPSARAGRFSQRAQWGLHLCIERNYNAWKIFDVHSKETVAACDVIFYEQLTLPTYLANLEEDQDPTGGFRGDRHFASTADEADWDEQNMDEASEEAGPLPYCSVGVLMDEAMDKELKALKERNTWKIVPIGVARNKIVLTGKWVFRVKTKADGTIDKFKARWVVRGFDQEHGRDFTETFAPVSRHTSLRILLAIAAMKKKKLRQIDVANAFLYGPVDAEIFVELPHGSHGEPNQGMYRLTKGTDYILLIVYVDDLLYIGSTNNVTTWFGGELQKDLTLTVSSTVTQYLGLNIQKEEDAIYLNAAKYADTIAKRFALTPTTISTPYRYTDKIEKGRLELSYCPTFEMAADYLTKKLGKQKFEYCMPLTGQSHVTSSDTPEAKGSLLALPAPPPPHITPYCSPRVALCCSAPHALLQPARRAMLPCASHPAAAIASCPTPASASRPATLRVLPCCSQRVTPYCSQRVVLCCPARRAPLQPARRALLPLASRPVAASASRPAASSASRPTAASASCSAAPHVAPCCPIHRAPYPAACYVPCPAEPRRQAQAVLPNPSRAALP